MKPVDFGRFGGFRFGGFRFGVGLLVLQLLWTSRPRSAQISASTSVRVVKPSSSTAAETVVSHSTFFRSRYSVLSSVGNRRANFLQIFSRVDDQNGSRAVPSFQLPSEPLTMSPPTHEGITHIPGNPTVFFWGGEGGRKGGRVIQSKRARNCAAEP